MPRSEEWSHSFFRDAEDNRATILEGFSAFPRLGEPILAALAAKISKLMDPSGPFPSRKEAMKELKVRSDDLIPITMAANMLASAIYSPPSTLTIESFIEQASQRSSCGMTIALPSRRSSPSTSTHIAQTSVGRCCVNGHRNWWLPHFVPLRLRQTFA